MKRTARASAEMGENGKGVERRQQADHALLPRARSADARLGSEPRRSRTAHIASRKEQRRASDHDGIRSRSRRSGRHRSMLPGRALAARTAGRNEIESVRKNQRLERFASLCAVEHAGHLRSDQRFVARAWRNAWNANTPNCVTSNMSKALRKGKVFVDWSQNDEHKTTICVYSLRAREEPTVSTPVTWSEVENCLKKKKAELLRFRSDQTLARVEKDGRPVRASGETETKAAKEMGRLTESVPKRSTNL